MVIVARKFGREMPVGTSVVDRDNDDAVVVMSPPFTDRFGTAMRFRAEDTYTFVDDPTYYYGK